MKKIATLGFILLFPLIIFASPSMQQIEQHGIMSMPALNQVYDKAQKGDSFAQAYLAEALLDGSIGILPNYQRAIYWSEKAIKQHEPLAYLNLAMLYREGNGVHKDLKKALEYYKLGFNGYLNKVKAKTYSKPELASMQFKIGNLYFWGVKGVVKQDLNKAFDLYMEAAEHGVAHAIKKVATMYRYGLGTKKDIAKAHLWSELLANIGVAEAQYIVGNDYLNGTGVNKNTKQGIYWIHRSSASGYYPAVVKLIQLQKAGYDVKLPKEVAKSVSQILENMTEVMEKAPIIKI